MLGLFHKGVCKPGTGPEHPGTLPEHPGTAPKHPQDTKEYPRTPPWRTRPPGTPSITKIRQKNTQTKKSHQLINKYHLSVTGERRLGQIDEFTQPLKILRK